MFLALYAKYTMILNEKGKGYISSSLASVISPRELRNLPDIFLKKLLKMFTLCLQVYFFFNCGRFQMIVLRTRILQHCQLHDCPVDIVLYICSLNTLSFSVRLWIPRFILKILSYSYILIEGDLWLVLLCVLEDFTACEKIYILCFPN